MNLLILDQDSVGLDFALRCVAEGHIVKVFIPHERDGTRIKTGDGLVDRVPDWEKWMPWADLIVPTTNHTYLDRLEDFRKMHYPIFGPSKQSAQLEIQRSYGMEVLKKYGIDVPPYKMFRTLDEAEAHLWKADRRYVFKTLGSEEDKALTYCAKDSADMINKITRWRKHGKKLKGACMLQEFIEGVEFGVSAWMGSNGFLKPKGENFEFKQLMSGDYGQATGEQGTVMVYTSKSKLAKAVLDPLEGFLMGIGHRGDLDVNCIVDSKGKAWPLEFTARLGWPAFFIMCSQHKEPCQWMLDAMNGKDTLEASEDVFAGVMITMPPYPNKGGQRADSQGVPIAGITEGDWDNLHLAECMMGKGVAGLKSRDMIVTSGTYVMCVTGQGNTVRQASRRAYKTVNEIHIPDMLVRDDIGEDLQEQLPELQKHGFATSLEY